jgi:hypothetical protein
VLAPKDERIDPEVERLAQSPMAQGIELKVQ